MVQTSFEPPFSFINIMRIACEECKAVYLVAEKIIGSKGRIVKCAKCSHCWQVEPVLLIDKSIKTKTCSLFYNRVLRSFIFLLVILNILSVFILGYENFSKYPILQKIYNKFSIYNHQGIILESFKFRKENNNLIITGYVINTSKEDKVIPYIRYTLLDSNNKVLTKMTIPHNNTIIKANEAFPINTKITNVQSNITQLQIDIGNQLNLLLR